MSTARRDASVLAGISDAVARIKEFEPIEVAFAGRLDETANTFTLGNFLGARTGSLEGLVSPVSAGLGGRCIAMGKPVFVADYVAARGITHQHDLPVTAEGLRSVFALPVRRHGKVEAVLYGASRSPRPFGDRLLQAAVDAVARTTRMPRGEALAFEDATAAALPVNYQLFTIERIRELYAELRAIASSASDPQLRGRLRQLVDPLRGCMNEPAGTRPGVVVLSPRELDVLAEVAVGYANAEVAKRLGLSVETIKSYLKSGMAKLGCHNRLEAVHRARSNGFLP